MAAKAGLDQALVRELSGHSMRVGAAQDMMGSGICISPVMVHERPSPIRSGSGARYVALSHVAIK